MAHPSSQSVIGFYHRHANEWHKLRQRYFAEKNWLDRFLSYLLANSTILDLGCGSGSPIASYFIEQGHYITGIDSSTPLIELCQQQHPTQQWINMDMRAIDLNMYFNGIIAWDSFFHLVQDDQQAMFDRFKNHAAPNSVLMFTSGTSNGEAVNDFLGEPLYHASLSPEEYRDLLHKNGFEVIDMVIEDPSCGGRTVWLAKFNN